MNESQARAAAFSAAQHDSLAAAIDQVCEVVVGKREQIQLAFACVLADGHLLIEDLPGVGKTTLAHAQALTLGMGFQRIQFTSDLLPSDILGVSIYHRERHSFEFHPGPVFSEVVLADEVNRATPKTQSALLEAMAERQVTVDGQTHKLPDPFFVIATQNPQDLAGTFPLPESQLDRFLMRLSLGYPDTAAERTLLAGRDRRDLLLDLPARLTGEEIRALQRTVTTIHASDALLDYVQALVTHTRESGWFHDGMSPRAGLALLRCARAWALIQGREYCLPEDVQKLFPSVAAHRLRPVSDETRSGDPVAETLELVPVP